MTLMQRRRALMSVAGGGSSPYEHGTWDDLFWQIDHGTYATAYSVGEILPLDLGTQGAIGAQIAAFDADMLSDGSGYAPVSFVSKHVLDGAHRMNPQLSPSAAPYTEGTGAIGGWGRSEMRTYCINTIKPLIPTAIRNRIVTVKKYSKIFNTDGTTTKNNDLTEDEIWIPSGRECGMGGDSSGPVYKYLFEETAASVSSATREKTKAGSTTAVIWWARSATHNSKFRIFNANGGGSSYNAQYASYFFPIGFCVK